MKTFIKILSIIFAVSFISFAFLVVTAILKETTILELLESVFKN